MRTAFSKALSVLLLFFFSYFLLRLFLLLKGHESNTWPCAPN